MSEVLATVSKLPLSLPGKLAALRWVDGPMGRKHPRLRDWARQHPEIAATSNWLERAWWGAAAGEICREYLHDPARRRRVLDLVEHVDTRDLDQACSSDEGVIIVTAHLGPPKLLMHWLIENRPSLLVWTNMRDLPLRHLQQEAKAVFLNPMDAGQRSVLLARSALHLRRGGTLLGAPDIASGGRIHSRTRYGYQWRCSLGLPALARTLGVRCVRGLALWQGGRLRITFRTVDPPQRDLNEDAWLASWIDTYLEQLDPILLGSPENLRFLNWAVKP